MLLVLKKSAFNKVNDNQIINILNIDLIEEKLNLYCSGLIVFKSRKINVLRELK